MTNDHNQYIKREEYVADDHVTVIPDNAIGLTINSHTAEFLVPYEDVKDDPIED